MRGRCRWVLATAAVLLGSPATAQQRELFVPADFGQGAVMNAGDPTPYTASAKLQVAVGLGPGGALRLGPVAALRFANPDWAVAAGVRAQWLSLRFGLGDRRWGLGLVGEQLWGTSDQRPGSLGLIGDLELLRFGGWIVHDWSSERTGFELSLGTDLRSLFAVLFPSTDADPFPDIP